MLFIQIGDTIIYCQIYQNQSRMLSSKVNKKKRKDEVVLSPFNVVRRITIFMTGLYQSCLDYHYRANLLQVVPLLHTKPSAKTLLHPKDRKKFQIIKNENIHPRCFQSIGIIMGQFQFQKEIRRMHGTGYAISKKLVVTCLHLIFLEQILNYIRFEGIQARCIYFYLNGKQYKVKNKLVYQIPSQPLINGCMKQQLVVLELEDPIQDIQFMEIGSFQENQTNPKLSIVGYPANNYDLKEAKNTFANQLTILQCKFVKFGQQAKETIKYRAKTYKGISGSPIVMTMKCIKFLAVGIHTDKNQGVYFNTQTVKHINQIKRKQLEIDEIQKYQNESYISQFDDFYQQEDMEECKNQEYQNKSKISEFDDFYQQEDMEQSQIDYVQCFGMLKYSQRI